MSITSLYVVWGISMYFFGKADGEKDGYMQIITFAVALCLSVAIYIGEN